MDNRGVGSSNSKINWFPGHMNVSLKALSGKIKQCDIIIYLLDARCPESCINPEFKELTSRKPVLFVANKADLAPTYIGDRYLYCVFTRNSSTKKIIKALKKLFPNKARIHAMVIGVPNCGKSTLINSLAGGAKTKVQNKAGVTRTPQWVEAAKHGSGFRLYLLDTPGILWPNIEDLRVAKNLAYIGSIKDDILDLTELACGLLKDINCCYTFEEFCKKRGFILNGEKIDEARGARAILTEFRAGKFGKYNLDKIGVLE